MSATNNSDPLAASGPKSKKKKNKKKANKGTTEHADPNGVKSAQDVENEEGEDDEDEPQPSSKESPSQNLDKSQSSNKQPAKGDTAHQAHSAHINGAAVSPASNGVDTKGQENTAPSDTTERLDALAKERDALRAEVAELRKSLESIAGKHEEEIAGVKTQLEESQSGKEHAETQYSNLLGKVNTIRSQLGERLKADAEELAQARSQIEGLEEQNRSMEETNKTFQSEMSNLSSENERQAQEISDLRSRTSTSQQNWIKERDDLISREAFAREEFETAKQAMQDWEVLAMEERSLRENLSDRVSEFEEQLSNQKEAYERAVTERDGQSQTVDGLQRALQDIQDARKQELRELVETNQTQLDTTKKQLEEAEEAATAAKSKLEGTEKELERALPFEKEVKEKNLLIGKLRHEAVILNDHLTKALRFLKKGRTEDNVDRQIVTNHLLHFLALERSDPKKFQVLQLIAALLNWTDEEREKAGLSRPGTSDSNLKIPISPYRRTPSMPSVNTASDLIPDSGGKETLAELWSDFLVREAQESAASGSVSGRGSGSQRESTASTPKPLV